MVSHCTASLKLTPWHEGTFASAVIYSPPRPPPSYCFASLLSCVQPSHPPSSLLAPASKMTFIILSLSSSHSFPAAQELGDKEKGKKMRHRRAKSQLGRVPPRQLELFSLWPAAPVENGSVFHCGGSDVTDSLGKYSCTYEAQAAGSERGGKGIVCQSPCEDSDQLQSQTAWIMARLAHRYVGIARSSRKHN